MLVLSRKDGEKIRIGENVFVTLVRGSNGKARLGIEAPADVQVVRDEIDDPNRAPRKKEPCPLGDKCPCLSRPKSQAG